MIALRRALAWLMAAALSACAGIAAAQQEGDVPYVPTPAKVVDAMLKLGKVSGGDFLIDLGSGDGRIVITAARQFGAHGFGVELKASLVNTANDEARRQGVADKVVFYTRNIFDTDFSKASVLTMYLLPAINLRLRDKVLALKPGTRVVSHDFDMGDWEPDEQITIAVPEKSYGAPSSRIYLWVVPAKASGKWRWKTAVVGGELPVELTLHQDFQKIGGSVLVSGRSALLVNPKLAADRVSFSVVDDYMPRHNFAGRVRGDALEGTFTVEGGSANAAPWTAARAGR